MLHGLLCPTTSSSKKKNNLFWTNYSSESIGIKTSEQHALYEFQRQLVKEGVGVILGGVTKCTYEHC